MSTLLLIQLGSTLAMTGLIWFVQVCHYPLFAAVGEEDFADYERQHRVRTTYVVAPLMLAELVTGVMFFQHPPGSIPAEVPTIGLALLIIIWCSTAFWQVPLHQRLSSGFNAPTCRSLVRSNWLRTIAWTLRSFLLLWVVWRLLPSEVS